MTKGFTNKEMLTRVMDKLDTIEIKVNETHELACATNGKVKLHTKALYGIYGVIISVVGWLIYLIR